MILIKETHDKNAKVLASIGGGSSHPYYAILLKEHHRKIFINNLVDLLTRYNLDGIDVDLEGNDIDKNYQSFIVELAAALKA